MRDKKKKISVIKEEKEEKVYDVLTQFAESYHNEYISDENNRREYAKKIIKEGIFLTAYYKNEAVGMMCGYANDVQTKCAYVSFFGIKSDIGMLKGIVLSNLLMTGVQYGKANGMKKIRLEVYKTNHHAYKLYRKFGFIDAGEASAASIFMEMPFSGIDKLYAMWEKGHRHF